MSKRRFRTRAEAVSELRLSPRQIDRLVQQGQLQRIKLRALAVRDSAGQPRALFVATQWRPVVTAATLTSASCICPLMPSGIRSRHCDQQAPNGGPTWLLHYCER